MHLQQMITQVRRYLNEPTANKWTDAEIADYLNYSQDYLEALIIQAWEDYFMKTYTFSYVASTAEYDLPFDFKIAKRVERQGLGTIKEIWPADLKDRGSIQISDSTTWGTSGGYEYYTLIGNQIKIMPTPSASTSDAVKMWYIPRLIGMHYGTATAGTAPATQICLAATPTAGEATSGDNDYYNGYKIYIISGTGSGQTRTITDYAGSTRMATVSTWTTNPDATSVYAILSGIPDEWHELLILLAAKRAAIRDEEENLMNMLQKEADILTRAMMVELNQRQIQQAPYMRMDSR